MPAPPSPSRPGTEAQRRPEAVAEPAEPRGAPLAGRQHLFLREEEMRLAQDLLLLGYRDFSAGTDAVLEELGLGRAHHRVLHFVARRPGLTMGDLLGLLGITKQSLNRVLAPLFERGFVRQSPGRDDRRQRLLHLSAEGAALERRLFERQRETVMAAYREAGPAAVDGFRRVLRGLMGRDARAQLDWLEGGPATHGAASGATSGAAATARGGGAKDAVPGAATGAQGTGAQGTGAQGEAQR